MRLRFTSRIPALKAERVIPTLWGCILRRLIQKGVQWDHAKNIPIGYNEEEAKIRMLLKNELRTPARNTWKIEHPFGLGDVERHLEQGGSAILTHTTESKQSLKVAGACIVPRSRITTSKSTLMLKPVCNKCAPNWNWGFNHPLTSIGMKQVIQPPRNYTHNRRNQTYDINDLITPLPYHKK